MILDKVTVLTMIKSTGIQEIYTYNHCRIKNLIQIIAALELLVAIVWVEYAYPAIII